MYKGLSAAAAHPQRPGKTHTEVCADRSAGGESRWYSSYEHFPLTGTPSTGSLSPSVMEFMEVDMVADAQDHPMADPMAEQGKRVWVGEVPSRVQLAIIQKVDLVSRFRLRRTCKTINDLVEKTRDSYPKICPGLSLWIVYSPFGRNIFIRVVKKEVASFLQNAMQIYSQSSGVSSRKVEVIGTEISDPLTQLATVTFDEIFVQRGPYEGNLPYTAAPSEVVTQLLIPMLNENRFKCRRLQLLGVTRDELPGIINPMKFDEFDGSRLNIELEHFFEVSHLKQCRQVLYSCMNIPNGKIYEKLAHFEHVELHNSSFLYKFSDKRICYMWVFRNFLYDFAECAKPPALKYIYMEGANFADPLHFEEFWPENLFLFRGQYTFEDKNGPDWVTTGMNLLYSAGKLAVVVSTTSFSEENRKEEIFFLDSYDRLDILDLVVSSVFRKIPIDVSLFAEIFCAVSMEDMAGVLFDVATHYGFYCCLS